MIGITQWQNNDTEYPLKLAGKVSGIFCDASFVVFDGVIPVLNSVSVNTTQLTLNITFDDVGFVDGICPIGVDSDVFHVRHNEQRWVIQCQRILLKLG